MDLNLGTISMLKEFNLVTIIIVISLKVVMEIHNYLQRVGGYR